MIVGRWPKENAVGGWPLLWPDTYLRRLNQTNEKIFYTKKHLLISQEHKLP
jgi:hypothetical protein